MDMEGSLLVANLPGVEIRHTKIAFDQEEICESTYRDAFAAGAINHAVKSLAWPKKTLPQHGDKDYITVWGVSCTSMSFVLGEERVKSCFPDGAVTTDMWLSVLAALRRLDAKRIAMLTPYIAELSHKNEQLLKDQGFSVVASMSLGLTRDVESSAVTPEYIEECVKKIAKEGNPDVVFIGCSALRACTPGFLSKLESQLDGVSVVTSTQAFLWNMLRTVNVDDKVEGYGKLFELGKQQTVAAQISNLMEIASKEELQEMSDSVTCQLTVGGEIGPRRPVCPSVLREDRIKAASVTKDELQGLLNERLNIHRG